MMLPPSYTASTEIRFALSRMEAEPAKSACALGRPGAVVQYARRRVEYCCWPKAYTRSSAVRTIWLGTTSEPPAPMAKKTFAPGTVVAVGVGVAVRVGVAVPVGVGVSLLR